VVIFALGFGYALYGTVPLVQAVFVGVKAAVVVIVLQALLNLARRALTDRSSWLLAGLGFAAMFFLSVPFPVIIAMAALWGYVQARGRMAQASAPAARVPFSRTCLTVAAWGTLWVVPIMTSWVLGATFLTDLALFFSKLAVATFGGAYAVLAYMTETVVATKGWLTTAQMIDALGLAETTPGPLILVTEFVGLLAGYAQGGPWMAVQAALVTLWVTFVPCFLWVFTGAPYIEGILARPRLKGALAGISASVVGVILNLSVWFALHVVFADLRDTSLGPVPEWSSIIPLNLALICVAAALVLRMHLSIAKVLGIMATLSGIVHVVM
jgi:chromate transporter